MLCIDTVSLDTASLSDQDKRQLLGVVRDFPSSSTLQTLCCQVIEVLVATGKPHTSHTPHTILKLCLCLFVALKILFLFVSASEGDIVFTAEFIRPLLHGIRVSIHILTPSHTTHPRHTHTVSFRVSDTTKGCSGTHHSSLN